MKEPKIILKKLPETNNEILTDPLYTSKQNLIKEPRLILNWLPENLLNKTVYKPSLKEPEIILEQESKSILQDKKFLKQLKLILKRLLENEKLKTIVENKIPLKEAKVILRHLPETGKLLKQPNIINKSIHEQNKNQYNLKESKLCLE